MEKEYIVESIQKKGESIERVVKPNKKKKKEFDSKKAKGKTFSKGVETMLKVTARNQINLSAIADNKSNILITVNSLIMSILISFSVAKVDKEPLIMIPTLVFMFFSILTIVFAIMSTRPTVSYNKYSKEDLLTNKVNLLFFGNFNQLDFDDYVKSMEDLMDDDEKLHYVMLKDQYSLGKVLAKKYRWLRVSFSVFLFGVVSAGISYIIVFLFLK
jgi:hypothetical protein